jgi:hypothetical protein
LHLPAQVYSSTKSLQVIAPVPYAVDGWYLGLATKYYRCYHVYIGKPHENESLTHSRGSQLKSPCPPRPKPTLQSPPFEISPLLSSIRRLLLRSLQRATAKLLQSDQRTTDTITSHSTDLSTRLPRTSEGGSSPSSNTASYSTNPSSVAPVLAAAQSPPTAPASTPPPPPVPTDPPTRVPAPSPYHRSRLITSSSYLTISTSSHIPTPHR